MSSEGGSVVEILGGHHHVKAFPAFGASIDHGVAGSGWIVRWRVVHEVRVAAAFHAHDDTGQTHGPSLPDCVPDSLSARGRAYHPVMDEDLQLARNPLLRILYAVLGLFFLGLGIVGYIVPVIPGTVNLLVAGACLSRMINYVHPDVVRAHWSGQGDALDAIQRVSEWSEDLLVVRLPSLFKRLVTRG